MKKNFYIIFSIVLLINFSGCTYTEKLKVKNKTKERENITLSRKEYQDFQNILSSYKNEILKNERVIESQRIEIQNLLSEYKKIINTKINHNERETNSNNLNNADEQPEISIPNKIDYNEYKINCGQETFHIPGWLELIRYSKPLCITAPKSYDLKVDYSQNLISYSDFISGYPSNQIYYSLSQLIVPQGKSALVLGVCGGKGSPLNDGDRVIASFKPNNSTNVTSDIGQQIKIISKRYNNLLQSYRALKGLIEEQNYIEYEKQLKIFNIDEVKLKELAIVLRAAIRGSIDKLLRQAIN